ADQVDSGSALLGERLPGTRPCAGGSLFRARVLGAVAGIPRHCSGAGRQAAPRASSCQDSALPWGACMRTTMLTQNSSTPTLVPLSTGTPPRSPTITL